MRGISVFFMEFYNNRAGAQKLREDPEAWG